MDSAAVRRLLAKHGRSDTSLRRPSADALAPVDRPWAPEDPYGGALADPQVASAFPALVLDVATARMDPGHLTPGATAVAYLSGLEAQPQLGDLLEAGSSRYAVLGVDVLDPSGEAVLYTLHLKA